MERYTTCRFIMKMGLVHHQINLHHLKLSQASEAAFNSDDAIWFDNVEHIKSIGQINKSKRKTKYEITCVLYIFWLEVLIKTGNGIPRRVMTSLAIPWTPCQSSLWSYFKGKMYVNKPANIQELKDERIQHFTGVEL